MLSESYISGVRPYQKKLVGDHPFCFKEVGWASGVFYCFFLFIKFKLIQYECGTEDKDFIYFRTCI